LVDGVHRRPTAPPRHQCQPLTRYWFAPPTAILTGMAFVGRSAELVAANAHAGRDRIQPAVDADEQLQGEMVALLVMLKPDGTELVDGVTKTMAGIERLRDVVTSTELLPDEDPALLSEPDRVDVYEVIEARLPSVVSP
jgi:hypothetical protein